MCVEGGGGFSEVREIGWVRVMWCKCFNEYNNHK